MAKIIPAASLIAPRISVVQPPSNGREKEQSGDQAAVTISLKKRAATLDRTVLSNPDPDVLVESLYTGLREEPALAIDAAGALSAERVQELLK